MMEKILIIWMVALNSLLYAQSDEKATLANTMSAEPIAGMVQEAAGKIVGTVIDVITRKPIENATVEILGSGSTVTTGKDGQYSIPNVKGGYYQVKAAAKGYVDGIQNNVHIVTGDEQGVFFSLQMDPTNPPEYVEVDIQPNVIENSAPKYPESARKEGIEATLWLKMIVSEKGVPEQVQVIKSSLQQKGIEMVIREESEEKDLTPLFAAVLKDFQRSAIESVHLWKFSPAVLKGKAVRIWVSVPVKYKLDAGHKNDKKK